MRVFPESESTEEQEEEAPGGRVWRLCGRPGRAGVRRRSGTEEGVEKRVNDWSLGWHWRSLGAASDAALHGPELELPCRPHVQHWRVKAVANRNE